MNAQELRIGNIVSASGNTGEVMEIYIAGLTLLNFPNVDSVTFSHPMEKIEGIQINKKWLLDFGFNDNGGGYYQHPEFNFFLFHMEEEDYYECYKQVPANDETGDYKTFQHVHKLQNLFFELFDEELEIKA